MLDVTTDRSFGRRATGQADFDRTGYRWMDADSLGVGWIPRARHSPRSTGQKKAWRATDLVLEPSRQAEPDTEPEPVGVIQHEVQPA